MEKGGQCWICGGMHSITCHNGHLDTSLHITTPQNSCPTQIQSCRRESRATIGMSCPAPQSSSMHRIFLNLSTIQHFTQKIRLNSPRTTINSVNRLRRSANSPRLAKSAERLSILTEFFVVIDELSHNLMYWHPLKTFFFFYKVHNLA